jgi:multicomponent Na+:H+ antiporter subunit D
MNNFLLAVPVLLPIIGGIVILADLFTHGERLESKTFRILLELLVIANSLVILWLITHAMGDTFILFRLFGDLSVQFHLDGMGAVFAGLIAFLWPLAMLYAFEYMEHEERQSAFYAFYIMTYGVTAGIALSGSFVTMYVFYEMLTLVTFPLVLYPLTKEAVRAARQYLYYSIGGAAFAFIALVFVLNYSSTGNSGFIPGGVIDIVEAAPYRNILYLVYVLAFFGFGVKAAVFPLHGWLPKASVAPTPVTALLHAVAVVKSGAFAIMRMTYFSFGVEFLRGSWAQYVVMAAAMITIVYGSTMAVRETHFKRRLAYSTIANLSYILFGVVQMTPLGLAAALSHMIAHAFMKINGFFCAGAVMHRADKNYIYELDGIGRQMPVTMGCFTVSALSLMGIPLFAGFISKWNLAAAGIESGGLFFSEGVKMGFLPYLGVGVILYSALMTSIYMLTVVVRAFFPKAAAVVQESLEKHSANDRNPVNVQNLVNDQELIGEEALKNQGSERSMVGKETVSDPTWRMLVPLVIFCIVIIGIGVYSAPLMKILYAIGGEVG